MKADNAYEKAVSARDGFLALTAQYKEEFMDKFRSQIQKFNAGEQDVLDLLVFEGVVDDFALPPLFDDVGGSQQAKLMGAGGLIEIQNARNVRYAHFAYAEGANYLRPRHVAAGGKKFRKGVERRGAGEVVAHCVFKIA